MDVLSILSGIKGKVLDAAHFDLLRSAYDLQKENIEQLKCNNDAIRDGNAVLKQRIEQLEAEIARLETENADLRRRVTDTGADEVEYQPSGLAKQILRIYRQVDNGLLFDKHAASVLRKSQLEIETAFSELTKQRVVDRGILGDRGAGYYLTDAGRRLVLALEPD
jgi:DNA anti-recombination protein RmuC